MPKLKSFLTSRVFLFVLLLAIIWLALVLIRTFYKRYQLDQEVSALKTEIGKLDKKQQDLNQLIKYFDDKDFLVKEAKDKLNLRAEGENVVVVPEASIIDSSSTVSTAFDPQNSEPKPEEQSVNNFVKWWRFLFER